MVTKDDGALARAPDAAIPEGNPASIEAASDDSARADEGGATNSFGPDLLVADMQSVVRLGSADDITAYAAGTVACNIGDERVSWVRTSNKHPVWFGNMYRLLDGRFEQIGMSWVTHAFYAVSEGFCGPCNDWTDGSELGVGCATPESANLNGIQGLLGPRSDVNAYSGYFPFPWSAPAPDSVISRRLQVHDVDLDPALNAGAKYFMEEQYIAADDAAAGNDDNNASYRRVNVVESSPGIYNLAINPAWPTQDGRPAIRAWKDYDPAVVETEVRVPGEGLFILAAKATDLGTGFWRYEYALQNVNSHRSAGSFRLCFTPGLVVENVGFHDVDYHSGEPYASTDWTASVTEVGVQWSAQNYAANPNANALRFGTVYDFGFEANAPPDAVRAAIDLFRPGTPSKVWVQTIGPPDCGNDYDADHDGQSGCFDFCPDTPAGACTCRGYGMCCVGCTGPCFFEYPRNLCVEDGSIPDECGDPRCKNGCPLLDMDNDGNRDLADFAGLQRCFSGQPGEPGFVAPTWDCLNRLDLNDNHAIDLDDYSQLFDLGLLEG